LHSQPAPKVPCSLVSSPREHDDGRESVVAHRFLGRHIARKAHSLPDSKASSQLFERRALSPRPGNNQNRVLETSCGEGLEKMGKSLDRFEAPKIQDHILPRTNG